MGNKINKVNAYLLFGIISICVLFYPAISFGGQGKTKISFEVQKKCTTKSGRRINNCRQYCIVVNKRKSWCSEQEHALSNDLLLRNFVLKAKNLTQKELKKIFKKATRVEDLLHQIPKRATQTQGMNENRNQRPATRF